MPRVGWGGGALDDLCDPRHALRRTAGPTYCDPGTDPVPLPASAAHLAWRVWFAGLALCAVALAILASTPLAPLLDPYVDAEAALWWFLWPLQPDPPANRRRLLFSSLTFSQPSSVSLVSHRAYQKVDPLLLSSIKHPAGRQSTRLLSTSEGVATDETRSATATGGHHTDGDVHRVVENGRSGRATSLPTVDTSPKATPTAARPAPTPTLHDLLEEVAGIAPRPAHVEIAASSSHSRLDGGGHLPPRPEEELSKQPPPTRDAVRHLDFPPLTLPEGRPSEESPSRMHTVVEAEAPATLALRAEDTVPGRKLASGQGWAYVWQLLETKKADIQEAEVFQNPGEELQYIRIWFKSAEERQKSGTADDLRVLEMELSNWEALLHHRREEVEENLRLSEEDGIVHLPAMQPKALALMKGLEPAEQLRQLRRERRRLRLMEEVLERRLDDVRHQLGSVLQYEKLYVKQELNAAEAEVKEGRQRLRTILRKLWALADPDTYWDGLMLETAGTEADVRVEEPTEVPTAAPVADGLAPSEAGGGVEADQEAQKAEKSMTDKISDLIHVITSRPALVEVEYRFKDQAETSKGPSEIEQVVVTYADGRQRTFRGDDALTEDGHEARSALATAAGAAMLGSGAGIAGLAVANMPSATAAVAAAAAGTTAAAVPAAGVAGVAGAAAAAGAGVGAAVGPVAAATAATAATTAAVTAAVAAAPAVAAGAVGAAGAAATGAATATGLAAAGVGTAAAATAATAAAAGAAPGIAGSTAAALGVAGGTAAAAGVVGGVAAGAGAAAGGTAAGTAAVAAGAAGAAGAATVGTGATLTGATAAAAAGTTAAAAGAATTAAGTAAAAAGSTAAAGAAAGAATAGAGAAVGGTAAAAAPAATAGALAAAGGAAAGVPAVPSMMAGGIAMFGSEGMRTDLLAGCFASFMSTLLMYPLDTLKTRIQIGQPPVSSKGLGDLYRGLGFALLKRCPEVAVYMSLYRHVRGAILGRSIPTLAHPAMEVLKLFMVAAIGALVGASVIRVPLELLNKQIQMGFTTRQAFSRLLKGKGTKELFLMSWLAIMARDIPYASIQFTLVHLLKSHVPKVLLLGVPPLVVQLLLAAAVGGLAGFLTTPLDTFSSRLMTRMKSKMNDPDPKNVQVDLEADGKAVVTYKRPSPLQAVGVIWEELKEKRAFWTGWQLRTASCAPSAMIFLTSYETMRAVLSNLGPGWHAA